MRGGKPRSVSGIRVLVVIPGGGADNSMVFARREMGFIEKKGVAVQWFFLASRTVLPTIVREVRRLRQAIREFEPSLIHAHYGSMTAFLCAVNTNLPLVITFRGSDLNPCPSNNRVRILFAHVLSQIASLRARRVICVSRELRGRLWWAKERTSVVTTGVDRELFKPVDKHQARASLNWPDQPVILFNAGAEPKIKRLDLALETLRCVKVRRNDVRMEVLQGSVDPQRIPLYLGAADALLVTSDYEGSPTIVKEAISCGLPVVSVDVGDVKERLAGITPSYIVARNPELLAEAVLQILDAGTRSNGPALSQALDLDYTVDRVLDTYSLALDFSRDST
jgi:teichuronic acid biosynthesis glycosyltransferase TuaC